MGVGAWEQQASTAPLVVIAAPTTGLATTDWALNLLQLQKVGPFECLTWRGLPFDVARNRLVKDAQAKKARYIWFVDTDVLPPVDALPRLMRWRLPIVSGLVWAKTGSTAIWMRTSEGTLAPIKDPRIEQTEGLITVDAVPAGCLLVDMRVFDVVPYPWFRWTVDDPVERKPEFQSEDFYFCGQAQANGFRIFVDAKVKCNHETTAPVDPFGRGLTPALSFATAN